MAGIGEHKGFPRDSGQSLRRWNLLGQNQRTTDTSEVFEEAETLSNQMQELSETWRKT